MVGVLSFNIINGSQYFIFQRVLVFLKIFSYLFIGTSQNFRG